MAASMIRAYVHYSLARPLNEVIWREQNVNYILQTLGISHIQNQSYHVTPAFFKKLKGSAAKTAKPVLNEEILNNYMVNKPKKTSDSLIEVWNGMTVKELATSAKRDVNDVLEVLHFLKKGQSFDENHALGTISVMSSVLKKLGKKAKLVPKKHEEQEIEAELVDIRQPQPDISQLVKRHPIVTIMGHVDHGKTTLLDALRNTSIVDLEFGGITQHIGAFDVTLKSGERVTFLDTPGHAAFTAMRYRGAHLTDIVVLVVAADDGVKDQTLQSIEMANRANVPIIVAINKIDKPNIDIKRTKNELAKHGIVVEDFGGDVQCVEISALKRINLERLTETIAAQAEIMDLKADPCGLVEGVAIECCNHIGRGKLVTAIIYRGTLRKGSLLVSGVASAKVRGMFNDSGRPVLEAKPAEVVQIIGWKALPTVGDEILEVKDDRILQQVLRFREKEKYKVLALEHKTASDKREEEYIAEYKKFLGLRRFYLHNRPLVRQIRLKQKESEKQRQVASDTNVPSINVIIKGDVAGTLEALLDIFGTYTFDNVCHLNVVHYGIGPIVETDIELADTFKGIIYGFNVETQNKIEQSARDKGIVLRHFNVVYKLIDDIKEEIDRILPEVDTEQILGEAQVQQNFIIKDGKKKMNVAGCRCVKGALLKSETYHIVRQGENIYTGKVASMRHLKEEMSSIEVNLDCGLLFEDPTVSFQPGDTIICFKTVKEKQKIDWNPGF